MERRIKNVIYYDPPEPWWRQILGFTIASVILVMCFLFRQLYGPGPALLMLGTGFLVLFVIGVWTKRRRRRRRELARRGNLPA